MIDSVEAGAGISNDDREKLIRFLADLHQLLVRLLSRQPPLLSPQTLALLEAAWEELENEGRFAEARNSIEAGKFDQRLEEHGLHRAQLDLKVGVFELADEAVARDERKRFRWPKGSKRLMAWALKAGNVILGSLADVVPGVSAIQEFKDGAEAALDHRVSARQRIASFLGRGSSTAGQVEEPPEPMRL
jgi:hypothetical protein